MPYVAKSARKTLDVTYQPLTVWELTYVVYKVVADYLTSEGKGVRFGDYAEAIAALECAKLELYCDQVRDYELLQKAVNGGVFPDA